MRSVTLKGAYSSPYTLKMRAVRRYRRIPYRAPDIEKAGRLLPLDQNLHASDEQLQLGVGHLLRKAGSTYAPLMVANADAIAAGVDEVVCEILGAEYHQAPFKYQAKCLTRLREADGSLDTSARSTVDDVLAGTGCDRLFE